MDSRQRLDDASTSIQMAIDAALSGTRTATPGIIQSFDPITMTCEVQPCIKGVQVNPATGEVSNAPLPLLVDCPVSFPSGGGCIMTFPLKEGDECLVVFSSRAIDSWWQSGGVQAPISLRTHDLSDGFVIPGARSKPKVPANVSGTAVQLRSDDGSTYIELDGAGSAVNITAPFGVNVNAPSTAFSGNVLVGTGASGTFTSKDGMTITVQDGIITNIF